MLTLAPCFNKSNSVAGITSGTCYITVQASQALCNKQNRTIKELLLYYVIQEVDCTLEQVISERHEWMSRGMFIAFLYSHDDLVFFSVFVASLLPSLVNVHIQHPPEAQVQIHQVARVKPGQTAETGHSVQQRSQPGNNHINGNGNGNGNSNGHNSVHSTGQNHGQNHHRPHIRLNGHVGRCFQETVDGKVCHVNKLRPV